MNKARRTFGFTLIELLVVISIIGLLAGLAVPALKNLGKSNVTVSAARQLLDGVARARQLALAQHTTVYMVFVDTNFWNCLLTGTLPAYVNTTAMTNLCDKQLSGYTFITLRSVGDQPGQGTTNYIDGWQSLPQGDYIASWKFESRASTNFFQDIADNRTYNIPGFSRTSANFIPFPSASAPGIATNLPYIAFNYLGQLTTEQLTPAASQVDEYIPLAQGTVSPAIDYTSKTYRVGSIGTVADAPAITEIPPGNSTNSAYNIIHIDWLTGRAREEVQQLR